MAGLGENLKSLSQMFNTSCTKLSNSTVSLCDQEEGPIFHVYPLLYTLLLDTVAWQAPDLPCHTGL